jgi:protein-S-isoprenylcysteine O-methyltransferase Ste14
MSALALVLFTLYIAVAFIGRAVLLRRRTGTAGWRGISGEPGSAAWWGGVLFALALLAGLAAPVAELTGLAPRLDPFDSTAVGVIGIALFAAGALGSIAVQAAMGASWRVGVDTGENTELVSRGPFALARNPFFTALVVTAAGLVLLVGNVVVLASFALLIVAVELQVRVVEEPYLIATHGSSYTTYAAEVGRFVPRIGRLGEQASSSVPRASYRS